MLQKIYQSFFYLLPPPLKRRVVKHRPYFAQTGKINCPGNKAVYFDHIDHSNLLLNYYWGGIKSFEFSTVSIFWALATKAKVIFDVGSYLGTYSLLASQANSSAQIFSFEPVPENCEMQKHLIDLNQATNIHLKPVAVGEKVTQTTFFLPGRSHSKLPNVGSLTNRFTEGKVHHGRSFKECKVNCVTLDSFVENENLNQVDLIKIDVEDHELELIRGSVQVIERFHPDIVVEVSLGSDNSQQLFNMLVAMGYKAYDISHFNVTAVKQISDCKNVKKVNLGRYSFAEILFSTKSADELAEINQIRRQSFQ